MRDSKKKSIIKAVSYRLLGSFVTFLIAFYFTGDTTSSGAISALDFIFKTALYYVHERIWNKIKI